MCMYATQLYALLFFDVNDKPINLPSRTFELSIITLTKKTKKYTKKHKGKRKFIFSFSQGIWPFLNIILPFVTATLKEESTIVWCPFVSWHPFCRTNYKEILLSNMPNKAYVSHQRIKMIWIHLHKQWVIYGRRVLIWFFQD